MQPIFASYSKSFVASSLALGFMSLHGAAVKPHCNSGLRLVAVENLAEDSPQYRAALLVKGQFAAAVQLDFLGEDTLVVASKDGTGISGQNRRFHLALDTIRLTQNSAAQAAGSKLELGTEVKFDIETTDTGIAALPSGNLLVNTGQQIRLLDRALVTTAVANARDLCGGPETLKPEAVIYRSHVLAASEDVGVVSVNTNPPQSPSILAPAPNATELTCWFSTRGFTPIAHTGGAFGLNATARDMLVYGTGGYTVAVSPERSDRVSIPPGRTCNIPQFEQDLPMMDLLHNRPAIVFWCRKGFISIEEHGQVKDLRMAGGDQWFLRANAWNAPVAIFVSGRLHMPILGDTIRSSAIARFVNYESGVSVELPPIEDQARQVYAGSTLAYAVSPNGHYVAVLHGGELTVYQTPQCALAGSTQASAGR